MLFDETNYAFWSISIRTHLMALGFDIFQSIMISYTAPTTPPIDTVEKKTTENDVKAVNFILSGLS
jgi:hypothetical protein